MNCTIKILLGFIIVVGMIIWLFPFFLNNAARFIVTQDLLSEANAIIVLSGDNNGERVDEAVAVYRSGYAKHMLMTGGPLAWHLTYASNMRDQAIFLGVPKEAILLEDKARSTFENAKFTLPIVKSKGFKTIILVSSPNHMRRALLVFKKVYGPEYKIIGWPAQKSIFNPHDWWKRHEDTQLVIWEWLSLVEYMLKGYL